MSTIAESVEEQKAQLGRSSSAPLVHLGREDLTGGERRYLEAALVDVDGEPLGLVRVRSLTSAELRALAMAAAEDETNVDLLLIAAGLVDEHNQQIFREVEARAGHMDGIDAAKVRALAQLIDEHTGFSQQAFSVERLEAAKKNSPPEGSSIV